MYFQINNLEKDLLKEIMNVGLSKAADALAVIIRSDTPIMLTTADIKTIETKELGQELSIYSDIVLAVKTQLTGDLEGVTLLLFYKEQLDWIVKHCLLNTVQDGKLMRESLLLEISNILSGALITQLSNIFELNLVGLPPESISLEAVENVEEALCQAIPTEPIVLSIRTHFLDNQLMIEFPLLFILEVESLSRVLNIIRQKGIYDYKLLKS